MKTLPLCAFSRWTLSTLVTLVLVTLAPPSAADIKFCPRWRFSYLDQGFGEDGLKHNTNASYGTTAASYTWARVTRNGNVVVPGGFLDSSGCTVGFPSQAGTYTITVRSYLMKPDGTMFYVRDGDDEADPSEISVNHTVPSPPPATESYNKWIGSGAGDPVPNAMAVASQFVRESAIGIAAGAEHSIIVNSDLAEAKEFDAHLSTFAGVNDASWKYVIGHEVGHTIQYGLFGLLDHDYSPVLVCNCSHVPPPYHLHCIQSREEMNAAQNEGWGHFVALDLTNDDTQGDGVFVYYKDFRCPDQWPGCNISGQMAPPMSFDGRAQYKWMDTHCPASGEGTHRGTEVDWMNFYFAMHTTGGAGQFYFTQFRDTYNQACVGLTCQDETATWPNLQSATSVLYGFGSLRAEHWQEMGAAYGVDRIP